jgi:predicted Zn-dependent peptidase
MFRRIVLDNGVRIVAERMPALNSVTVGIWVNVGSRDEDAGEEGLSHFLEHMFFKGTATRTAAEISHEIDALGGELNAFTTRETTTFYVKVLDQYLKQAIALLADLFHHSRFLPKEIEKEKQVVLEEIRMVEDDPEDLVQELHTQQILPKHPLGKPILGDAAAIQRLRREDLLGYVRDHYQASDTVIAMAGNFEFKPAMALLRRAFESAPEGNGVRLRRWPPQVTGGMQVRRKPLEQAHLCLGLPGIQHDHKDRYAAHVLNAQLGGSVSSRLFQVVRERYGLAYSIYSYLSAFSDAGTLTIYAGSRPREAARVLDLICRELKRLRREPVKPEELERAKNYLKGSLMLGLDSTSSRMSKLAKDELYEGRHVGLDELLARIDRVSAGEILRLGRELFDPARLGVTVLGPVRRAAVEAALN